jgi:hypothetical protein
MKIENSQPLGDRHATKQLTHLSGRGEGKDNGSDYDTARGRNEAEARGSLKPS